MKLCMGAPLPIWQVSGFQIYLATSHSFFVSVVNLLMTYYLVSGTHQDLYKAQAARAFKNCIEDILWLSSITVIFGQFSET